MIGELVAAGAEIFVYQLTQKFKSSGRDVEVWTFYKATDIHPGDEKAAEVEREMLKGLEKAGITVRQIGKTPRADYRLTWRTLKNWAEAAQPYIVHTHLEEISFHVCVALRSFNFPIVQTMHNENIRRPALLRHFFSRYCDRFICISDQVEAVTLKYIDKEKCVLIPNGIPTDSYVNPTRDYHVAVEEMIAVGRLAEQKNHMMLIQAMYELKNKLQAEGKSCPCVRIYGSGPLQQILATEIERLNLTTEVILAGITTDIKSCLKESQIYIMSSIAEGMSISLLEAMSAGLPIVITAVSGVADLLVDRVSALIVPINDSHLMAEALYELLSDGNLRCILGQAASEQAQRFDISVCADRHLALYDELISIKK